MDAYYEMAAAEFAEDVSAFVEATINNGDKMTQKYIKQCADSGKFDNVQMLIICGGIVSGLTIDQVKLYANPKINADQMYMISRILENNPDLTPTANDIKFLLGLDVLDKCV